MSASLDQPCTVFRLLAGGFEGPQYRFTYSPTRELLPVARAGFTGPADGSPPAPDTLQTMLEVARRLSAGFDFIRVDLYSVEGRVYFGELTHYPSSGLEPFEPESFDFDLGRHWHLEPGYWRQG